MRAFRAIRWSVGMLLAAALLLVAGGCQQDRLIAANDFATALYREAAIARDSGFVTQAELDKFKPERKALDAALDEAGRRQRSGDLLGLDAALTIAERAMSELKPLVADLAARRATNTARRPTATTAPAADPNPRDGDAWTP